MIRLRTCVLNLIMDRWRARQFSASSQVILVARVQVLSQVGFPESNLAEHLAYGGIKSLRSRTYN